MSTDSSELDAIRRRVQALTWLATFLAIATGCLVLLQFLPNREIRARRVVVIDDRERPRITLTAEVGQSTIIVAGDDAEPQVVIASTGQGGNMTLKDDEGIDRIDVNGSKRPSVVLFSEGRALSPLLRALDDEE